MVITHLVLNYSELFYKISTQYYTFFSISTSIIRVFALGLFIFTAMMATADNSIRVSTSTNEILKIAAPIILSNSIPQIHFFTNTYFLGQYSNNALAANALAGVFFLVLQMACFGLANGIQILMSRRAGEDNRTEIGNIFTQGATLGWCFSLLIIVAGYWGAPFLFETIVKNIEVRNLAIEFIKIRSLGLPLLFTGILMVQFFIVIKKSKLILIGTLVSTVLNIFFDYTLITGQIGFSAMGIKGAAWASLIADIGLVVVNFSIIILFKYHKEFNIQFSKKINTTILKQISNLSAPIILQYVLSIGSWELFFLFVEHLDTNGNSLAVSQILRSVFGIAGIMTWGLAGTCNTMVSNLIGQNRKNEVLYLIKKIALISLVSTFAIGSWVFIFPSTFLHIYTGNSTLIQLGIMPLRLLILVTLLLSFSTVIFNGALGTGNSRITVSIEFIAIVVYTLYIYFVIEKFKLSLSWAWASEFVYWSTLLILSTIYLKSGKWKKKEL